MATTDVFLCVGVPGATRRSERFTIEVDRLMLVMLCVGCRRGRCLETSHVKNHEINADERSSPHQSPFSGTPRRRPGLLI